MEVKKEKYKRIRGTILKLLAYQHPGTIDSKVLYFLLDDLSYTISEDEFKSHCCYLAEKNLIKIEERKTSGVEIQMIVISSRGLDLLDGFIDELGVDVRF
jgi:hypothetical protein